MVIEPYEKIIQDFLGAVIIDGSRVIDVGCGTGWTTLYLAETKPRCHVDGVDIDERKLQQVHAQFLKVDKDHVARFQSCSAERLSEHFGTAEYDFAVSSHSLHHYTEPVSALQQIYSVLKLRGRLLLTELEPAYGKTIDDCSRYSLSEIIAFINKTHLIVQQAVEKQPGVFLVLAGKT